MLEFLCSLSFMNVCFQMLKLLCNKCFWFYQYLRSNSLQPCEQSSVLFARSLYRFICKNKLQITKHIKLIAFVVYNGWGEHTNSFDQKSKNKGWSIEQTVLQKLTFLYLYHIHLFIEVLLILSLFMILPHWFTRYTN